MVDWISTSKGTGFIESSTFIKSLGGNAANVAIALSRLGTISQVLAKVGDDIQGKYLLEVLKNESVEVEKVIIDSEKPTAQCYVFTANDDDNTFLNWPPGNAAQMLASNEISDNTIGNIDIIHATGISLTSEPRRSAILKTLQIAREENVAVSFDAGFPTGEGEEAKDSVKEAMGLADIIKLNLLELIYWNKQISPENDSITRDISLLYESPPSSGFESDGNSCMKHIPEELLVQLAKTIFDRYEPKLLTVTLAAEGSFVLTKDDHINVPVYKVDTVAGVGAGDAYIAGLIHKLMEDSKEEKFVDYLDRLNVDQLISSTSYASAVGALATRSLSAWESLPGDKEVQDLLNTYKSKSK